MVRSSYVFLRIILIILVLTQIIIVILIIFVLKIGFIQIVAERLELQRLTCEPIDGTRNELLLDVLAERVVELQALFDVGCSIVILVRWRLGRREEVEKGVRWDGLLDNAGLLGV